MAPLSSSGRQILSIGSFSVLLHRGPFNHPPYYLLLTRASSFLLLRVGFFLDPWESAANRFCPSLYTPVLSANHILFRSDEFVSAFPPFSNPMSMYLEKRNF